MRHLSSSKSIGLVILAAGMLMTGCGGSSNPTGGVDLTAGSPQVVGSPQPEIVATVNGQPITMETFQRELARFEAGRAALGWQAADENALKRQVLDVLIDNELFRQLAAQQGITVSNETVDTEINTEAQQYGQDYFNAWLADNYYTLDEFREYVRLQLMVAQLRQPIIESVPNVTEQVHARHILVNTQAEAEQILARLQAGEDFATLAAQYSQDVTTRNNGGDLGWFPRGGLLVPEVEDAAFSMAPGQVSGVIVSAWGAHIVQTLEFDPARQVEPETHDRLIQKALENWRLGLRSGADIQYLISFTP